METTKHFWSFGKLVTVLRVALPQDYSVSWWFFSYLPQLLPLYPLISPFSWVFWFLINIFQPWKWYTQITNYKVKPKRALKILSTRKYKYLVMDDENLFLCMKLGFNTIWCFCHMPFAFNIIFSISWQLRPMHMYLFLLYVKV